MDDIEIKIEKNNLKNSIKLANEQVSIIQKISIISNIKNKYPVNSKTKCLFNIEDGMITPIMLNKVIHKYAISNNLLEGNIYRVDANLSEALNLSQEQIDGINNATSKSDEGCMSRFNCISFFVNCFELE